MLAQLVTFSIDGVDPRQVWVEVDIHPGLPAFTIVGLGDAAVRESRDRIRAAIKNSKFKFPETRITANLAPAFLRKAGPGFDCAIALGVLVYQAYDTANSLNDRELSQRAADLAGAVSRDAAGRLQLVLPAKLAAAYAQSIVQSRPYHDGNRRTALACALVFLDVNGYDRHAFNQDNLVEAITWLAKSELDRDNFAQYLRDAYAGPNWAFALFPLARNWPIKWGWQPTQACWWSRWCLAAQPSGQGFAAVPSAPIWATRQLCWEEI